MTKKTETKDKKPKALIEVMGSEVVELDPKEKFVLVNGVKSEVVEYLEIPEGRDEERPMPEGVKFGNVMVKNPKGKICTITIKS